MPREVAVIGTGMTKSGKSQVPSWDLFAEATLEAVNEAGIEVSEIQGLHIGNVYSAFTENQTNISPKVLSAIGLENHIPCIRYETACSSSSVAFRQAYINIVSGMYDVLLVGGTERLRAVKGSITQQAMATSMDGTERGAGLTFAGYWAFVAKTYSRRYGIPLDNLQELLAKISVKNHFHGAFNKNAHFQNEITLDDVKNSVVVASPIRLLDCCPFSDGAAAVILASGNYAKRCKNPVWIEGSGQASGKFLLTEHEDLSLNPAITKAAEDAYKQARMGPKDIDVSELHDCVNIHEVLCLEGVGLYQKGEGIYSAAEGKTYFDGETPANLSGGLKARGHPVGATGAYQICEITRQLRGNFGGKRADNPHIGLTVNVGGTGTVVTVHILRKD